MSFAFPKVEAETSVPITERDASFMDYHSARFSSGSLHTMGEAITRWAGEWFDNSEKIDPATANKEYGIPESGLVFDEPVTRDRAKAMRDRHEKLALSQAQLETMGEVGLGRGITGFIAEAVGGMMHPIDFGINFIPFVGEAKLVEAGMGPMTRALTRGLLVSEETIAKHVTFPRITAAVVDATAGNILAEIPVAIQARRDKEQYEFSDFAANVLGGAVIAGGIHGLGLTYRGVMERARESHALLTPEIQDRMMRDAIQQTAAGKSVDVHAHATVDPKLMEAEWRNMEASVRAEGMKIAQADPELRTVTIDKAIEEAKAIVEKPDISASDKAVISKLIDRVEKGDVDPIVVDNLAAMVNRSIDYEASAKMYGQENYNMRSAIDASTKLAAESNDPVLKQRLEENISKLYEKLPRVEAIRRSLDRHKEDPRYQAFVKDRVDKYVAEQKKLFDVEYQKKLAVTEAARAKQEIGPLAKPEDIAKLDGTRVPEAAVADVKEDVATLTKDMESDLKALEEENPELAKEVRKMLDQELKAIDDPEPKAIEAALNCLINE